MRTRHWIFGRGAAGTPAADAGLALLRIGAGLLLAYLHGLGKVPPQEGFVERVGGLGFPAPLFFAWVAAAVEFGGGLLIAIGLLTRPVAFVLVAHFIVVVFMAHAGDPLDGRELPILFGLIAVMLALNGPGRYSVDAWLGQASHRSPSTPSLR